MNDISIEIKSITKQKSNSKMLCVPECITNISLWNLIYNNLELNVQTKYIKIQILVAIAPP